MSILIFAIVVLIIVGLILWAVQMIPLPSPFTPLVQVLIVIVAILLICQRAGLL